MSILPKSIYQYFNILFHGQKKNPKVCTEFQKTPNNNSVEKEQSYRTHTSGFQTIVQI